MRHRPCSHLGARLAVSFLFLLPKRGVRNDRAKSRARGARICWMRAPRMPSLWQRHTGDPRAFRAHGEAQLECRKTTQAGPASEAVFACVPHADGLFGLLDVPGMATYASVPPFVRAVARTCTRAVRPCYRRLPCPLWEGRALPRATGPGIVADLRIPLPRLEDDRGAPLNGAGWRDDIYPTANVKNKRRTFTNYFF